MRNKKQDDEKRFSRILESFSGMKLGKLQSENKASIWSSYKGRKVNALAPGAEEGRDKLRKATGSRK